jgi:hypothetical protein
VRASVPGAGSYTDEQLMSIAGAICLLEGRDAGQAAVALENSRFLARDRREVAEIAQRTACK